MEHGNWKEPNYDPREHGFWKATLNSPDGGYEDNYYFADTLRGIIIAFGDFFGHMIVKRYDSDGYPRKNIVVPIKYGARAKSHDFRVEQESGTDYYIPLPNLTFKITNIQHAPDRAVSTTYLRTIYGKYMMSKGATEEEIDLMVEDMHPIPYNIGIELTGNCDLLSDATQMIEALTIAFTPENFLFVKEFWFLDCRRDIKMQMDSITLDMDDSFGQEHKRDITVKANFVLECYFYRPVKKTQLLEKVITAAYLGKATDYNVNGGIEDPTKPVPQKVYEHKNF